MAAGRSAARFRDGLSRRKQKGEACLKPVCLCVRAVGRAAEIEISHMGNGDNKSADKGQHAFAVFTQEIVTGQSGKSQNADTKNAAAQDRYVFVALAAQCDAERAEGDNHP